MYSDRIFLGLLFISCISNGYSSGKAAKRQTVNSNLQESLGTAINQAAPVVQGLLQGFFNPAPNSGINNPWNFAGQPVRRPGFNFQLQQPPPGFGPPPGRPRPPHPSGQVSGKPPPPPPPVDGANPSKPPLPPPPPQQQQHGGGEQGKLKKQNCKRNPNNPRCRAAAASGIPPELALAAWASNIRSGVLELPPGIPSPSGFNPQRSYNLALNSPNIAFQTCFTPVGKTGRCRLVKHCAKRSITSSLESLLSYACPIRNDIMGVCCPENVFETPPATPQPVAPSGEVSPAPNPQTSQQEQQQNAAEPLPNYIDTIDIRIVGKSCGIFYRRSKRVVGGQVSPIPEWMWVAAILRKNSSQRCAGVLVGPSHVLTTASCVNTMRVRDLKVRLGDYNFTKPESSGRVFAVDDIILHDDFNRFSGENDIALIRLVDSAVGANQAIVPVCLPAPSLLLDEQDAFVVGLSTISSGGTSVDVIQEIVLPLWRNEDCKPVFEKEIPDAHLCAGYTVGGADSCGGDPGGPLMLQSDSGNWILIGMNQGCGQRNKPGIFTRIFPYVNWIKNKTV